MRGAEGAGQPGSPAPRVESHRLPRTERLTGVQCGHGLQTACLNGGSPFYCWQPGTVGTWAEAAALCSKCFPPCSLSRQRGPECLLTLQVSLSLFYSGGLNRGFGYPGSGEDGCLPTEPPFSPGSVQSPGCACFLPVEAARGRVCPASSCPPGCGGTRSSSAHLCPASAWQPPPLARGLAHSLPGVLSSELSPGAPPWAQVESRELPNLPERCARSTRA